MAYCKKCGAYIPDGQSNCLACGYDEEAERRAAEEKRQREEKFGGGFAAKEYEAEKREMERRRREEERQRREAERDERRKEYEQRRREKQEEDRRWAQQEHERRAQEYENHSEFDVPTAEPVRNSDLEPMKHKAMAIMSYISLFFILPMILCKDDKFAMYHAKQGMALFIYGLISTALAAIPVVGWIFPLAKVYFMVKGIINAAQDKMEPLPYIGKYAEK